MDMGPHVVGICNQQHWAALEHAWACQIEYRSSLLVRIRFV
jgi:hypothetical protein